MYMWQMIKQFIINWVKAQFHGNPLVDNTSEYVGKFANAVQVGMIGSVSVILLGFIGSFVFVVGVIRGWF